MAPQHSYSHDLSPREFFLFPRLKNDVMGLDFGAQENIQEAVTDQPKAISILASPALCGFPIFNFIGDT